MGTPIQVRQGFGYQCIILKLVAHPLECCCIHI